MQSSLLQNFRKFLTIKEYNLLQYRKMNTICTLPDKQLVVCNSSGMKPQLTHLNGSKVP